MWQFLFCGIARVGTQQLSPECLRNLLKGLTAGSRPFGKPGPETNEKLSSDSFRLVQLLKSRTIGPSETKGKHAKNKGK